ncbi:MAG TPA: EAL domain-containing protein [Thermoanaerobaculia bacterium]|jgi:diguanylate cyclase (GGDEF)-like protein/PAS domain S-box-containing protein|nr:EAL domain-containing protein [Thermoanaerobaculia bacterium]
MMNLSPRSSDMPPAAFARDASATSTADAADELSALRRDQELAIATLAAIGDGIIRTGAHGKIDYLNHAAEELTGWSGERGLGRRVGEVFRLVDEITRRPLADPVGRCLDEGRIVRSADHALLLSADGKEYSVHHSAAPIYDLAGRALGAVLVFKDVTELRGMEREMIYLASHDPLTGLLNRREFEARLQRAILTARLDGREHALLYLDLDEFKVINDSCGHLAGDEMLKQVTALLRANVRRSDALARLGGDEFGVLLENCPAPRARQTAEELCRALRDFRFSLREHVFEVGASIGLVPIGSDSGDLVQLLSAADAACYVAKDRGRNRVQEYEPDDTGVAQHHGEMRWIQRIHDAFEQRRFRLYYQKIEPLGRTAGGADPEAFCEVFLRMLDRDGQPIEPAGFVAAAERYHLIDSLDRWVVQTAFGAIAEAQRGGAGAALFAINISAQSLSDERFLAFVVAELAARRVDPRRICFEITETAALSRLGSALRFLSTLKEKGCRFALDDFGGGLSSFSHLRNLPVDFLKIDGALVREMTVDPVKRAMVEAINQIGHVMGLRTVAEWVESREILELLEAMGVDYGQGFWFSGVEPLIHDH